MERTLIPEGLLTAEEFARLPDDEPWRQELVRGRVVREPPASYEHGVTGMRLAVRLSRHIEQHGLGEVVGADTGFLLFTDPDTVRAPDAAFVARERLPGERGAGFFRGAPDLAVEVTSPSNTAREMIGKMLDYLEAGTRLAWLVDPPSRTVTVYRSLDSIRIIPVTGVLDGEDVLPGFSLPLAELFAR